MSHEAGRPPLALLCLESCAPVGGVVPCGAGAHGGGAAAPVLARQLDVQVLPGCRVGQHAVRLCDALEQPVGAVAHPLLSLRTATGLPSEIS